MSDILSPDEIRELFLLLDPNPMFAGDQNVSPQEGPIGSGNVNPVGFIADKAIDSSLLFADTIIPPRVVTALPALPDAAFPQGVFVFLTTDQKLYRNTTGSAWSRSVDGLDIIADSITAGQIAAGAIGASEIAAGSIEADKLSIGSRNIGSAGNQILNASFEELSATNLPKSWFGASGAEPSGEGYDGAGGGLTYATDAAQFNHGTRGFKLTASSATKGGSVASKSFPVTPGEVYYVSAWARASTAIADGLRVRFATGSVEDFERAHASFSFTDIVADGSLGTSFAKSAGYATVPAGDTWARVILYNNLPNVATSITFDNVVCERVSGGLANSDGNVLIDASGIAVTNGKITVTNPTGTVVIDGTSNIFKISASGTMIGTETTGNSETTPASLALTGLGSVSEIPAHIAYVALGSAATNPRVIGPGFSRTQLWAAVGTGGPTEYNFIALKAYGRVLARLSAVPGTVTLDITIDNHTGANFTIYCRYYVFKEVGM